MISIFSIFFQEKILSFFISVISKKRFSFNKLSVKSFKLNFKRLKKVSTSFILETYRSANVIVPREVDPKNIEKPTIIFTHISDIFSIIKENILRVSTLLWIDFIFFLSASFASL